MVQPRPNVLRRLKERLRPLRREVLALFLAIRHPGTPWYARLVAAAVVVYAVSPIDLIPDPVPVLGYLDDLLLIPLGVLLVRLLIPPAVLAECRARAESGPPVGRGWKWAGGAIMGGLWVLGAAAVAWWVWGR